MDAVLGELWMHSAVFCGEWSIEIDEFAVVMFCKSGDAAIYIADWLYRLNLWTPMVAIGRKDCTENNIDIISLRHLCHCLYIFHYQAVRDISLILRNVVCAAADNNAIGVAGDDISFKSLDHLSSNLATLSTIYKVVIAEKFRVSTVLFTIPTVENRISHKHRARLCV